MPHEHEHLVEPETSPLQRRWGMFVVFALVLLISYSLLYALDLVPEMQKSADGDGSVTVGKGASEEPTVSVSSSADASPMARPINALPKRIIIDAIGVDAVINNPTSTDIAVLDKALLSGVVRYPGSGDLEDHTNMFLFGHSSHLPVVNNELFRVFNELSELEAGDVIRVQSDGFEYRYMVSSVDLVDAAEAWVELSNRQKKLTLSTCNSFGAPTDRFVVQADYMGRSSL